jgi:hypothetical protein
MRRGGRAIGAVGAIGVIGLLTRRARSAPRLDPARDAMLEARRERIRAARVALTRPSGEEAS